MTKAVALYTQTEGHPLFIVEMLRASEKKGAVSEQASIPDSVSLPPKVQAVIRSRLAQLSPSARELVGLAATVGRAFTMEVLAQASDGDEDTLVRALDELWQRRLIREQGDNGYDFSHDRIREVAYASVSSAAAAAAPPPRGRSAGTDICRMNWIPSVANSQPIMSMPAYRKQAINAFYQQAAEVAQRIYAHAECH